MRKLFSVSVIFVLAGGLGPLIARDSPAEKASALYPHKPGKIQTSLSSLNEVPFDKVRIDDLFWASRIEKTRDVTIPDLLRIAEEQGKIDNLRIIAGRNKTGHIRVYNSPDSDIWKIMEAASYIRIAARVILDRPSIEIIGNNGRIIIAFRRGPKGQVSTVKTFADGGNAELISLKVDELKSAWKK